MAYTVGGTIELNDIANRFWDDYLDAATTAESYSRTSYTVPGGTDTGNLSHAGVISGRGGGTANDPGNTSRPSRGLYGNDYGSVGGVIDASDIYDALVAEANRFVGLRSTQWIVRSRYGRRSGGTNSYGTWSVHVDETALRYNTGATASTQGTPAGADRPDRGEIVDIGSSGVNNSLEELMRVVRDTYVTNRDALNTVRNSINTCHNSCHSSHSSRGRR